MVGIRVAREAVYAAVQCGTVLDVGRRISCGLNQNKEEIPVQGKGYFWNIVTGPWDFCKVT